MVRSVFASILPANVWIDGPHSAMRLVHLNRSGTSDTLTESSDLGIALASVGSTTVRHVVDRVRECGNSIPVWFALHVTLEVCERLLSYRAKLDATSKLGPDCLQFLGSDHVSITRTGLVKLIDVAAGPSARATLPSRSSGREQSRSVHVVSERSPLPKCSARTDIEALGRVLYELLTLVALPSDATMGPLAFVPPSHLAPWVTRGIDKIVQRAIVNGSPDSFVRLSEVAAALGNHLSHRRQAVHAEHIAAFVQVVTHSVGRRDAGPPVAASSTESACQNLVRTAGLSAARSVAVESSAGGPESKIVERPARARTTPMSSGASPNSGSAHDWDSAILSARRDSARPVAIAPERSDPVLAWELTLEGGADTALASSAFDEGLERMRCGDLLGAELAWTRAVELDPSHRAAAVNLRLLRKRRG